MGAAVDQLKASAQLADGNLMLQVDKVLMASLARVAGDEEGQPCYDSWMFYT